MIFWFLVLVVVIFEIAVWYKRAGQALATRYWYECIDAGEEPNVFIFCAAFALWPVVLMIMAIRWAREKIFR